MCPVTHEMGLYFQRTLRAGTRKSLLFEMNLFIFSFASSLFFLASIAYGRDYSPAKAFSLPLALRVVFFDIQQKKRDCDQSQSRFFLLQDQSVLL